MTLYNETTGWTFDPRWVNNVAYNNETGFSVHKSWRDEFRNNIVFNSTGFHLKFTQEAMNNGPHTFNNNLWFTANKTNSIEFKGKAVSVAEFQAGVGETNGLSVDPMFVSTVAGSEDFNLQAGSPAKGAADNGLDLGAFAVYPQTDFGWDANRQTADIQVYFDQVISASDRGGQVQLIVKLSKASANAISADILPVAGDALSGEDFSLSGTTVIFQPGETSKTVSVNVIGDADFDELVAFRISNVTNAVSGARYLHVLRINKIPKIRAYAGLDKTVWESNNSGGAEVVLDGSRSQNPVGSTTSYVWTIQGAEIATGESPAVSLPIGIHNITLTLNDGAGNLSSDEVVVTVKEVSGIWLEAECGVVGSLWNVETDNNASNSTYVTIQPGNNSSASAPSNATGLLTYTFNAAESGNYTVYLRVICPTANDDSFYLKMDNGSFVSWNGITISNSWVWVASPTTYNLTAGTHTFTIGYREDGTKLDKIWITNGNTAPEGLGPDAGNCSPNSTNSASFSAVSVYPNPVKDLLYISLPDSPASILIYDVNGNVVWQQQLNGDALPINVSGYKKGIYFVKITSRNQSLVTKLIKD